MAEDNDKTETAKAPWVRPRPANPKPRTSDTAQKPASAPAPEPAPVADEAAPEPVVEPLDAVVGWLVIASGPGRGHDFRLLAGMNSVGRDEDMAVKLDFGDSGIALRHHCRVTFDPRSRRFFLSPGDGRELIYAPDDQPILTTIPLASGQRFVAGSTTLMFVALCSETFFWN